MRRLNELLGSATSWGISLGLHAFVFVAMSIAVWYAAKPALPVGCTMVMNIPRRPKAELPAALDRRSLGGPTAPIPRVEAGDGGEPGIPASEVAWIAPVQDELPAFEPSPFRPEQLFPAPLPIGMGTGPRRQPEPVSIRTPAAEGPFAGRVRKHVGRGGGDGNGATVETETAMLGGLRWLARHQAKDGRWAAESFADECTGAKCSGRGSRENDVGITGLALLAFLGAGFTPLSHDVWTDPVSGKRIQVGEVVKSGLKWLMSRQDKEGRFAHTTCETYNHSIAALAMAEAYGMTRSALLQDSAQRGIDFVLQAQNPYKAWRYSKRCGDNDTSNTGFAVMALHSAQLAGLAGCEAAFDGVRVWLDEVGDEYGGTGYTARGNGSHAMAAVGVMSRCFMDGGPKDRRASIGAALVASRLPEWSQGSINSYDWYYGTLAVFLGDDGGKSWKSWNAAMTATLLPHQHPLKDGCLEGSWDPEQDTHAMRGAGRVYMTALNTMTLEVYYRYPKAFGVRR